MILKKYWLILICQCFCNNIKAKSGKQAYCQQLQEVTLLTEVVVSLCFSNKKDLKFSNMLFLLTYFFVPRHKENCNQ